MQIRALNPAEDSHILGKERARDPWSLMTVKSINLRFP